MTRESYGDTVMDFLYDASGRPYAFYHNGTLYYYVLNLQGDVVRIINENGSAKCTYRYDAWGRIISGPSSGVGVDNPLRYRGYYYDTETGFYYLQSRYYDPAICRFINADAFASTGQNALGYNMFAYCGNNPVNYVDYGGEFWGIVAAIATVIVVALICTSSENQTPYYEQQAKEKYNSSTVAVYQREKPPESKKTINAEVYHPDAPYNEKTNISIDHSLSVQSGYEQDAVLDIIVGSPYYSEDVFGNKDFMKAQWIAHNVSYDIASSGPVGNWIIRIVSGSSTPVKSSSSLDIRSLNNIIKRQTLVYTVISWFC